MPFESLFSFVAGAKNPERADVSQEVLDTGLQALIHFKEFGWPAMEHAHPPIEALPLLAMIAQSNYDKEEKAKIFFNRLPSLAVKSIYRRGSDIPYVRILYTSVPDANETKKASPEDPMPIMIVSFTGSTTTQDWLDDLNAFLHLKGDFLHGELGFVSMHRGFADWLTRPLDRTTKEYLWDAIKAGEHAVRGLLDHTLQPGTKKEYTTVYSQTIDTIFEIRQSLLARYGSGNEGDSHVLKTFIIGHSLGGAVAALFGMRVAGVKLRDDQATATRATFLKLFSDPRRPMPTEDNPKGLTPDGIERAGPRVRPLLVLTFGAPRFLWRTDPDAKDEFTRYGNHWLQQLPIVRLVNERDPVPHVPVGRGAPEGLKTIQIHQEEETLHIPESSLEKTDIVPLPMKTVDGVSYEHLGRQWVLDANGGMSEMGDKADTYRDGALSLFKDIFSHSLRENIIKQHSMALYLHRVTAILKQQSAGASPLSAA